MNLECLFRPRSIAVVGASQNPRKVGGVPVRLLQELGWGGAILPVNPTAGEVQGLRAYAQVSDLPQAPDLAIVAVPAPAVEEAVAALAERGAGAAVVLSSGFAETGEPGAAAQQRMAERARAAGMALLGPNCLGVMNLRQRMFATFSPAPLAGLPPTGKVAVVSQSGAFGAYAYSLARLGGLGLSHWVTTGNEAMLGVADIIEWLAQDDETQVILGYIEGTRDGPALARALAQARAAGKPVVLTKVGRTEAGARAAMSHTASLAGEDAVYQAVFDAAGAIRARTVEEMFRLGRAFAAGALPAGPRLGIVTVSGGVGTLMADAASDAGLELPPLPSDIAAELRRRIPFCSTANPVDVTGQVTADFEVLDLALLGAARSGAYDALVLFAAAAMASPSFAPQVLRCVREARAAAPGVPLVVSGIADEATRAQLAELGCLLYEEPTHAVEDLAARLRWARGGTQPHGPAIEPVHAAAGLRDEVQAMAFFEAHGVPCAPHRLVKTPDEAVAARHALGGHAVVMKIVSEDLMHKSDVGGVRVGLKTDADLREAFDGIASAVAQRAPQARQQGMLVARKLDPVAEVMLGARHDPVFGPVIVVGLGGVAVELHARTAVLPAPTHEAAVREKLHELGVMKLLGGWRGRPVVDAQPLVEAVLRFSRLAAALGARIEAMEINPLMVTPDGVMAADAVLWIR